MNIFISAMVYDNGKSGIAEYTNSLTRALTMQSNPKQSKLTIALLERDIQHFPVNDKKLDIIAIPNCFANPVLNIFWHIFVLPFLVLKSTCDFLILPAINRRMMLWSPKPVLGIVHDLSQFAVSGKYDLFRTLYVKTILPLMLPSLTWVVAISQNTKNDVVKYWGLDEQKISVSYNGYDKSLFQKEAPENIEQILNLYSLNEDYLFYVSRVEHPGKNHIKLIQAFETLPENQTESIQLVFAGSDWNGAEEVKEYIRHSSKSDQIKLLGFVPSEHLPALYHGALLSLFPSLYEGFGIPLVEAMACGTPTLCSNNSALGEVAASAALTFNPESIEDIQQKLALALSQENLRQTLVQKGLARCQDFDWHKLTKHICSIFRAYDDAPYKNSTPSQPLKGHSQNIH